MSKKSKRVRATEAWARCYSVIFTHRDLNRFYHTYKVTENLYGQPSGLLWYTMRHKVFHDVVMPEWLSSTHVQHRNELLKIVKEVLGNGLANELQLISAKRTW